MHTEVFSNIDTLIEMSGSTLDMDEVSTELLTLKRQIKNKKNEIEDLRNLISDNRYFSASNELVDKNIEISLKNKISRLNRKLKDIKLSIQDIKQDEKKLHEDITDLKTKINNNLEYIEVIKAKSLSNDKNKYYSNLLKKEEENIKLLNKELDNKNKLYKNILKELELNNKALEELNEKLHKEEARLEDILDSLKNPNSYIDEDLKEIDEGKLKRLNEDLEKLEKRELEILTDAKVIGYDAKELIADNDINEAINKVKELVTIVKAKPYMDINNLNILDDELEKLESSRIELTSLIDNKSYEGVNSDTINKRIEYLKLRIESNNKSIENYENEITNIDEFISNTLSIAIDDLEKEVLNIEGILNNYKNMLKEKDKSLKTRASLENAILKKEKEKKVLYGILDSYKSNLISKIDETNILNGLIIKLKNENESFNKELENLKKLSMLDFKTKDLIEEEKDKENLRNINEEIKNIKNRKKFDKSPNEIYDLIEMSLEPYKTPVLRVEKNKNKSVEIDSLFDVAPLKEEKIERLKVIEMIPVETVKKSNGGN